MAILTHVMDVSGLTPFFKECKKLMEVYQHVSGVCLHAAYIRSGGVAFDLTHRLLDDIRRWVLDLSLPSRFWNIVSVGLCCVVA